MDELVKIALGETEGVMKEAYKDLVSPSAKPIGTMLSYLPRTIRLWFIKWEKWIVNGEESLKLTVETLKDKVNRIPDEKQCEPEPYVAIPAIQQIPYCYDSEVLREMYANLLASSMNKDKKWSVHPSYVDIIKQLTPDEAKVLKKLPRSSINLVPLVDINIDYDVAKGSITIARNITSIELYAVCDNPDSMCSYLENLERLQLIKVSSDERIVDESVYDDIDNSERVLEIKKTPLIEGQTFSLKKKYYYVTDFGVSFIKCCIDG